MVSEAPLAITPAQYVKNCDCFRQTWTSAHPNYVRCKDVTFLKMRKLDKKNLHFSPSPVLYSSYPQETG